LSVSFTNDADLGDNHRVHIIFVSILISYPFCCLLLTSIFQVSAHDKASGKSQKITITSDKGRLSEDEINRMVMEAEECAEADHAVKESIEAKNQLESYLFRLKSSIDETLKSNIAQNDSEIVRKVITDAFAWLESNNQASKEAYDTKRNEVETVAQPIITKAYSASRNDNNTGEASSSGGEGPSVEEVE
jgi:heat shock protein 1/8